MKTVIVWLKKEPPPIYETIFSYSFCIKKSEELTNCPIVLVPENFTVQKLTTLLRTDFPGARFLVVVTWPETILSASAIKLFETHLKPGLLIGPVFNESLYPQQTVALPYPYLDTKTFSEVATLLISSNREIETLVLDPACFAVEIETLKVLPPNFSVNQIPSYSDLPKRILSGALVHKFTEYYNAKREDLVKLVPPETKYVLDVGCARGGFGRTLKKVFPTITVDGVEINSELARTAQVSYRKVWIGKFEEVNLPSNFYDVVIMGDVLEHLYDPWKALKKVFSVLKPKGWLIVSIPNTSQWTVVRQLLEGEFEYIPLGLLCVSHIRFFTLKSLSKILNECGFFLESIERQKPPPTPSGLLLIEALLKTGLGSREELLTATILIGARKRK